MPNVVLVLDMLRGFLEPGHPLYCGDEARAIIPRVRDLLELAQVAGSKVIFVADTHDPDDREFEVFPPHCIRGTDETEVIPELRPFASEIIPKTRYSAFFGTPLEQRLRDLAPGRLIIVGVCTDICVLHTTADARDRDYAVEIPSECVASFNPDAHGWALKHAREILGAQVTGAGDRASA